MENKVFNSIINALISDEIDNHKYLCELIEIIDNNITTEVNRRIIPKDLEINQFKKRFRANNNDNNLKLIQRIIISSIEDVKSAYHSWENIIWSSLFLSIYGNFENKIYLICSIIKEYNNIESSPKDLRGSGLKRARDYLYNVAKYQFSISNDEWKLSEIYNNVKNDLAHNGGKIKRTNMQCIELYKSIKSEPQLTINKSNMIIVTKGFVLELENLLYNIYLRMCDEFVGL